MVRTLPRSMASDRFPEDAGRHQGRTSGSPPGSVQRSIEDDYQAALPPSIHAPSALSKRRLL